MNLRLAYHPEGGRTLTDLSSRAGVIRLAYNPGPVNAYKALENPMNPIIQSACADGQAERNGALEPDAPSIRLAHIHGAQGDNVLLGRKGVKRLDEQRLQDVSPTVRLATTVAYGSMSPEAYERHYAARDNAPALLVSYVYLEPFLKNRHNYFYRDWVLDSGAFSAHNSGKEITLQSYIDTCQKLLSDDPTLTEIFALDVIGDWQASLKNCEEMWKQGIPAIPCYHVGEPESALLEMVKSYPKIALGGAVGYRGKDKWAEQCFARIWPKKVHGFGFGGEKSIMALPWHSVDATNWEIGPCKFGRWNSFGKMSVRGSKQNLRAEVEWYLALEQRARQKWRKQMLELETVAPSLRLAVDASAVSGQRANEAFAPSVRLVANGNGGREDVKALAFMPCAKVSIKRGKK